MIRLLLLAFPPAWRRRYRGELESLVDDVGGLRPRLVFDIVRAGLAERRAAILDRLKGGELVVIGSAWRHPGTWALSGALLALPTALFVIGSSAAYGMEVDAARAVMDPVSGWLETWPALNTLLVLGPPLGVLLALAPLLRFEMRARSQSGEAILGIRLRSLNLAVVAACGALVTVLGWYFVGEVLLGHAG